jgi:hypothetical protein
VRLCQVTVIVVEGGLTRFEIPRRGGLNRRGDVGEFARGANGNSGGVGTDVSRMRRVNCRRIDSDQAKQQQ